MAEQSLVNNFDFLLFGQSNDPKIPKFQGYVSSIDPTTAGIGVMIGGSQNTYKSLLGTICNRCGLKRRGPANAAAAGIVSSFEWETSLGITRVLNVIPDGSTYDLQVEFDNGSGLNYYTILTGMQSGLLSFSPWYSDTLQKDVLIFVNGQQELNEWGGGVASIITANNATGIIMGTYSPNSVNGPPYGISAGGIGYALGDLLTISAGNNDAVLEVDQISDNSAVASVTIANAGSGYVVGDTVKIATSSSFFVILKVTSIGGGGTVTGLSIQANGVGYTVSSAHATVALSASGTGLTVNITSVGVTILAWHLKNNGTGYSIANNVATTGGSGSGATAAIKAVGQGRVTISGTQTLSQLGFAGSLTPTSDTGSTNGGSLIVNGTTYTYQALGDNGFSFVGVSPDPTVTAGGVALSPVTVTDTSPESAVVSARLEETFENDWVNTIGNQLYIGDYSSRLVHISSSIDTSLDSVYGYLDYIVPDFRAPGNPDLLILDSNSRGATSKTGQKGNAVVFGSLGDSYSVTRAQEVFTANDSSGDVFIYENVSIDKSTSSDLSSPLGQDFIDSIGDTIIFLDDNHQLRQFGTLRNLTTPVYPILSLDVYTEFSNIDFTAGKLRAVSEQSGETVYITAPKTGNLYFYQIREKVDAVGNLTSERLWQPPFIVGCSRVAVIGGITYVYSNSNPQLYQLWDTGQFSDDSPSNEPIPYESHAIFAYISLAQRTRQLFFDKLYYEGYMTRGTTLYNNIYQEYQGAKNIATVTVNNPVNPGKKVAKFYDSTSTPSLGDISLGLVPLGEGVSGIGIQARNIPKFRAMRRTQAADMFEFALDMASYLVDCQWELLILGANIQSTTRQPTGIMA